MVGMAGSSVPVSVSTPWTNGGWPVSIDMWDGSVHELGA